MWGLISAENLYIRDVLECHAVPKCVAVGGTGKNYQDDVSNLFK